MYKKKMLLVMLAAGSMAQAMQQAKSQNADVDAKAAAAAAEVAAPQEESIRLRLSVASASASYAGQERAVESKAAAYVAVTQVIADNAQKQRNPMSPFRWVATKCGDTVLGIGAMVLNELRVGKLHHGTKPGSEGRRLERAAEDLAATKNYIGMRELLQRAKDLGLQVSESVRKIGVELFEQQRSEVIAHTYQQLLVGMRDMGMVQDGATFAGKTTKKLDPEEILKDLCAEVQLLFAIEQKKALEAARAKAAAGKPEGKAQSST